MIENDKHTTYNTFKTLQQLSSSWDGRPWPQ